MVAILLSLIFPLTIWLVVYLGLAMFAEHGERVREVIRFRPGQSSRAGVA